MRHDCFKWQGMSFWGDENILKLVVMAAQHWECTQANEMYTLEG